MYNIGLYLGQDGITVTDTTTPFSSGVTTYFGPPTPADATITSSADASQTSTSTPSSPTTGNWFADVLNSITTTVKTVAPAALNLVQQAQFNSVNAQRAAKGLPPLSASQYVSQYQVPTATVGIASDTMKSLLWVAGGLGAVALIVGLRR